ncbi:MAG: hypothetical protein JW942_08700 [Opitutales bacterium]|nr:hypothetical protein [Opitutales bacterium]
MHKRVAELYSRGPRAERAKQLRRITVMYDAALNACRSKDAEALDSALEILKGALDYSAWPELAMNLNAHYDECHAKGREGRFAEAGRILASLRKAWLDAK